MAGAPGGPRWFWYSTRTSDCISLDAEAYPTTIYDHWPLPWPEWACKAPDGGVHYNATLASIDVKVAAPPSGKDEFTWTCQFQVTVLSRAWFSLIEDLVEPDRIGVGRLFVGGRELEGWVTVHGRRPPILSSAEGWDKTCPICGNSFSLIRGRVSFQDPAVLEMPLIVNDTGIFVREDEVIRRNLRPPMGAFKPKPVRYVARKISAN